MPELSVNIKAPTGPAGKEHAAPANDAEDRLETEFFLRHSRRLLDIAWRFPKTDHRA